MKYLSSILVFSLLAMPLASNALEDTKKSEDQAVKIQKDQVTISAKGLDVRSVIYDLFQQTEQNFIIDDGVRHVLYLNLHEVTFREALHVVLKHANLGYEVKDNITYIGKSRSKNFEARIVNPKSNPTTVPTNTTPKIKLGKVTEQELQKRLTTRLAITDIREVFAEFSRQTKIKIEVHKDVPRYKIDAFLLDTSLKYALDVVTDAANLKYVLTDDKTIRIEPKSKP